MRYSSKRSRSMRNDLDSDWANSAGLPMLLVGLMIILTAMILPDDVPVAYPSSTSAESVITVNSIAEN